MDELDGEIAGEVAGRVHDALEECEIDRAGDAGGLEVQLEDLAELQGEADVLLEIGATIVTPPRERPEYKPAGYYAVLITDPDGIKYEIVTYPRPDDV